jgi:hypothetical protein
MSRGALLAILCCSLAASAAYAAPDALTKGMWSAGYEFSGADDTIFMGYNISDMNKLSGILGLNSNDPGEEIQGGEVVEGDSETGWAIGGSFDHYLSSLSNDNFAPFIGVLASYGESAGDESGNTRIEGRFGLEAWPVDALGVGGHVGVGYTDFGSEDVGDEDLDNGSFVGLFRSGVTATFYWDF